MGEAVPISRCKIYVLSMFLDGVINCLGPAMSLFTRATVQRREEEKTNEGTYKSKLFKFLYIQITCECIAHTPHVLDAHCGEHL